MTTTNEQISTATTTDGRLQRITRVLRRAAGDEGRRVMATFASETLPAIARRITLPAALKLDAAVTGANGVAYLVAAGPLGDLLGVAPALLRALGVVLVVFAAMLVLVATRPVPPRPAVIAIVTVNAAWAIGSIVVAVAGWTSPTAVGAVWIIAQALVVAGFAELQAMALRR